MKDMFEIIVKTLKDAYGAETYDAGKVHKKIELTDFIEEHEEVQNLINDIIRKEAHKLSGGKAKDIQIDYEDGMLEYAFSW